MSYDKVLILSQNLFFSPIRLQQACFIQSWRCTGTPSVLIQRTIGWLPYVLSIDLDKKLLHRLQYDDSEYLLKLITQDNLLTRHTRTGHYVNPYDDFTSWQGAMNGPTVRIGSTNESSFRASEILSLMFRVMAQCNSGSKTSRMVAITSRKTTPLEASTGSARELIWPCQTVVDALRACVSTDRQSRSSHEKCFHLSNYMLSSTLHNPSADNALRTLRLQLTWSSLSLQIIVKEVLVPSHRTSEPQRVI